MKSKSLLWCDLTPQHVEELQAASIQEREQILASIFSLQDFEESYKSRILLELYVQTIGFAFKSDFTPPKTSTFFSILKLIHFHAITTPGITLDSLFGLFKTLLVNHSVPRPPYSVLVFGLPDVQLITDYVTNTYFRHLKLYLYTFTKKRILHLKHVAVNVEIPLSLPPLSEATLLPPENTDLPFSALSPANTPYPPTFLESSESASMEHASRPPLSHSMEHETEDHAHPRSSSPPLSITAVISNELSREVQALANASVTSQFDKLKSEFEKKIKQHEQVLLEKLELLETKTKKGKPK